MDELEQILRARQGDQAAWTALVRVHQEPVFRLAYLFLGNAADAEDVAQETFVRALQALDRFDAQRPLRPWLLSIAKNLARNRRRSVRRYLAAMGRLAQAAPRRNSANLEAHMARRWEAETLWQAIRRLQGNDQEVIYLRYFLELSVLETAQALAVAEGTVKSRLHRALGRLQRVIEAEFPMLQEEQQR